MQVPAKCEPAKVHIVHFYLPKQVNDINDEHQLWKRHSGTKHWRSNIFSLVTSSKETSLDLQTSIINFFFISPPLKHISLYSFLKSVLVFVLCLNQVYCMQKGYSSDENGWQIWIFQVILHWGKVILRFHDFGNHSEPWKSC